MSSTASSANNSEPKDAPSTRTALLSSQIGVCRICFEETDNRSLLSPCKCSGTQAFVHRGCLKDMYAVTKKKACGVCNAQYALEYKEMRPWREWTWPQALGDQWEDEVDFKCAILFLILCLRAAIYLLTTGTTKTLEQMNAVTGEGRLCLIWWASFVINFIYYGDVIWRVTERWIDENSVYEWKNHKKRTATN